MFTFGLFTTHIPYIAFVISFAYCMFSGVDNVNNGKVRLAENSVWVQQQVNDFDKTTVSTCNYHFERYNEQAKNDLIFCLHFKQKWKLDFKSSIQHQNFIAEQPFCRPPPVMV